MLIDLRDKIEIHVKETKPPEWIWRKAHEIFEIDDKETIYTYGNVIHDPRGKHQRLPESIVAHEATHVRQQAKIGPDAWWERYFTDAIFRRDQELEAYRAQYAHFCTLNGDRNAQARYLNIIASYAASPLYRVDLTKNEAMRLIRNKK